ncbi:MAG: magnesium transporter CorA family protein [Mesorhizobium sp.]
MLKAYAVANNVLVPREPLDGGSLPAGLVWIDMIEPTPEEDRRVEALIGAPIPTRDEMVEIEESSRFYAEGGALYLTAPVIHASDTGTPGIAPVTFILANGVLLTVRYTAPKPFGLFASNAGKPGNNLVTDACGPMTILLGLIEAITDRLADMLESASQRLDAESDRLIAGASKGRPMSTDEFRDGLKLIGKEGEFLSKVRESLGGIARLLLYVQANGKVDKAKSQTRAWLKSLQRDTQSLTEHVTYLSERTIFLLDTVVGLVSVEQNAIIKIFSVAAVVFMPPTLVASIYGMNFKHMPELEWLLGYPFAIVLMIVAAVVPLLFFRKKGWL